MYVCMYVCILALPLCSPVFPAKKHGFSSVFAKRTSKNIEFFQIFGKRMQEAQASKKAGRGNRAWDPCFATPAPRRLRLVERHQIAARYVGDPPPKKIHKMALLTSNPKNQTAYNKIGKIHRKQDKNHQATQKPEQPTTKYLIKA